MNVLIVKLNATGDVVRTTPLLHKVAGRVTWITADINVPLLSGVAANLRCLPWSQRAQALDTPYGLVINLEDEMETAQFVRTVQHDRVFGAHLGTDERVCYTDDAGEWFDMSLISRFGRQRADELKYRNRRSYQEIVFAGLGWRFADEPYLLPATPASDLQGDVAIAPVAGPVWPMKNWAHYATLQQRLQDAGLRVNVLPKRNTLLEHVADIRNHRCLVGGDSLPMHLALGSGVGCVTLFNCTSPWEIHDYALQTKLVSPLLGEFFYQRGINDRAVSAITLDEALDAVMARLDIPLAAAERR
jgi:heptosyltransferase II